jgi:exonuclease-1
MAFDQNSPQHPSRPTLKSSRRKDPNFLSYCVRKAKFLEAQGLVPFLVIDGAPLPSKVGTDAKRRSDRMKSFNRGLELLKEGKVSVEGVTS